MKLAGEVGGGGSVGNLWRFSNRASLLLTSLVMVVAAVGVRATVLSVRLYLDFDGAAPAATNMPWFNLNFQGVGPGQVLLSISANGLTGTEFLSDFYLNLNPLLNPHKLSFRRVSASGDFDSPTIDS